MARKSDFNASVLLPPGLTIPAIQKAIEYVEREASKFVEVYYEQANVFSALAGIFAIKALDSHSVYEKHRHPDIAQQRFPDLRRRGSGLNPRPEESLEVKASKRPWPVQSHYDHPGWYLVFRYLIDPTESIHAGRSVIVWRVDAAFLEKSDWKYESSTAGTEGGGRTHTFGLIKPAAMLRDKAVYQRADVVLKGGKPVPSNGN